MLGINTITEFFVGQADETEIPLAFEIATAEIEDGALVALADGRIGFVQMVSASPYGEPFQRAYVYAADWDNERWADWCKLDELTVVG